MDAEGFGDVTGGSDERVYQERKKWSTAEKDNNIGDNESTRRERETCRGKRERVERLNG